ncbi:hypothetical protein NML43_27340 [Rhodopseudomonas palustris]|uniref:hypothetical protein n=1 Tax=Rhodopseudomonas palustris TaxID=1076 RepID=UPI0020CD7882|nr:hypothetical protein [Rhodopseudomonas palustris]MCP9630820.1 hypothetical protein [Rhodopseudomonas palustris]
MIAQAGRLRPLRLCLQTKKLCHVVIQPVGPARRLQYPVPAHVEVEDDLVAYVTTAASDPFVAVRSAAFGARNLPFIHFHPTAKSGTSAEEVIREIKRLLKIEKNPPTVTRAEGRLTLRGGFLKSTASSPTIITAHNGCGSL